MARWLRLGAPNTGGPGSIPGQGTRSHMLQLTASAANKLINYKKPHLLGSLLPKEMKNNKCWERHGKIGSLVHFWLKVLVAQSYPFLFRPHGLQPSRLLHPRASPGKNTGVGSHSLLQGIFPTQGSNPCLLHRRQILYQLSHQGSPGAFLVGMD